MRVLTCPSEYWWSLESETLDGIAFGILYSHTADRELAEARAKAFALEVLGPLAKPTMVVASAVDAWLLAGPSRPAPVHRRKPGSLAVRCSGCSTPIRIAGRHFGIVSIFGTLCERCRGASA